MEQHYTSGLGKNTVVPEEIKGWNWGAFLLNWIWGIGNSTYIALLMFVPLVNLVMLFVLGAKGNEWAWKNRTWRDIEHFKSTQKKWRNAGFVMLFIITPMLFIPVLSLLKGEAWQLSLEAVSAHPEVIAQVGENPEPGYFVLGEINYSGSGGQANINYSIEGSVSEAEVYVYATKLTDVWELREVLVIVHGSGERIAVVTQSN